MAKLYLGIDVSSRELVIAAFEDSRPLGRLPNTKADIQRWLKTLPAGCVLGMEATGTYHRLLADLAYGAGHTVYVLNPREVAQYLKSLRSRGKTDLIDARGIARYTHNETADCHPYGPLSPAQQTIATLIDRRAQVVKHRASLKMSFSHTALCDDKSFKDLLDAFHKFIADIDLQLKRLRAADAVLEQQCRRLSAIQGVGPLVSLVLAQRMNRTAYRNSDALVAALGLDPRPRDSGQYCGRRHLSKRGNPEERRLLYLAAVSACRNPTWRAIRDKLLAKGLPNTAAYCVIARKILRIAFAIWHSDREFDITKVGNACVAT